MTRAARRTIVQASCLAAMTVTLALVARADESIAPSTAVRIHYAAEKTEVVTLDEGVKYFTNRDYKLRDVPPEMVGLRAARLKS